MICPTCGLQIPDKSNFCSHCGASLTVQARAISSSQGDASSQPGSETVGGTTKYFMGSRPDEAEEHDIWKCHPSMRTAIPGIALAVAVGLIVIVILAIASPGWGAAVNIAIQGLVVLVVLWIIARYFIRRHSLNYRLSSQRLFITHGLINKRTDEVELEKYKDIFVNQDVWDKVVGCGDIEIVTSDVTHPTIRIIDVIDPVGKKESIRVAARQRKSMLGITRREEL